MNKVAENKVSPLNKNLENLKPFRQTQSKRAESALASPPKEATITEQAKTLNQATPAPEPETPQADSMIEKAEVLAKTIAKTPVLPVNVASGSKKIQEKIADKKSEAPVHFIKKPAVIFVEGFSMFGISNGDGISEMSENFPGAKKFNWTEHDEILKQIKKHSPEQPVILVGHSFGGDTAIEVAQELNSAKNGFRSIDLLVSIDAVGMNKTIIPMNVKSNLNFFGEGLIPFVHGDPTVARNTKYTDVTNELRSDMHSRMEDNPEVQFQIFEKINEVLGKGESNEILIEISETSQIKDILENIKNSL